MDIKEIAEKIRIEVLEEFGYQHRYTQEESMMKQAQERLINTAIESYKAELLKEAGEPVAARRKVAMWQGGDDYKYEWAVVKEHTPGTEPLYTSDQVAAAILKATKPLDERIQRRMDDIRLQAERQVSLEDKCREVSTQLVAAQEELNQCSGLLDDSLRSIEMLEDQLAKTEQRVAEYNELIYAVQTKTPDETRHQTALRYIRNAENRPSNATANGASS